MPYLWTEPEVAAEVDGVKIYHTYKNGNEVMDYWYTADPTQDDIEGWYDGPGYRSTSATSSFQGLSGTSSTPVSSWNTSSCINW